MIYPNFAATLGVLATCATGCGGDEKCGPGDDATSSFSASVEDTTMHFSNLHAGANNDCPGDDGGPTSVTIQGQQSDPNATGFFTVCLPRPDRVTDSPLSLGDRNLVQIVDFRGQDQDGCTFDIDKDEDLSSGTIALIGFCDNGTHPDGFSVEMNGALPFRRTCPTDGGPGDTQTAKLELAGHAVVVFDQI